MSERPWIERASVLLTHAASQLTQRWLAPPVLPPLDGEFVASTLEAEREPPRRWAAFLAWAKAEAATFPWLGSFMARKDPDGSRLIRALTDHLASVRAAGGGMLLWGDDDYPPLLAGLDDPPIALSYLGERKLLRGPKTAVIGSRKASALALSESFALGRALAERGVTVVSGGAFGCDIAAHAGVLAARQGPPAPAIVVMAGGLSRLYPDGNAAYFRALQRRGALFLSERLWQSPSRPADFGVRNRIISGLCGATAVMQAARKSGAMVTARIALDQGRDVAVLTHPPGDVRASGSASLLADGAEGFADAPSYLSRMSAEVPERTSY